MYLQELPTTIGKLKKLTNFNVDRNRLTEIPVDVSYICRVPTSTGNHGKPGKSQKKFHAWKNHGI